MQRSNGKEQSLLKIRITPGGVYNGTQRRSSGVFQGGGFGVDGGFLKRGDEMPFIIGAMALVVMLALFVGINFLGYEQTKYFAPRYAAIERSVYEESASFNEGMQRDLENLKMQYESGDAATKMALRATIIHRFSVYRNSLPAHLSEFYTRLVEHE